MPLTIMRRCESFCLLCQLLNAIFRLARSEQVKEWVQQITDTVVADCRALSLEFKWIGGNWRGKLQVPTTPDMSHVPSPSVSVAIMQQTGAGMSAYTSAVGSGADGAVTATYETPAVVVLVSIYAAAGSA